jgi:hypothetical protein
MHYLDEEARVSTTISEKNQSYIIACNSNMDVFSVIQSKLTAKTIQLQ